MSTAERLSLAALCGDESAAQLLQDAPDPRLPWKAWCQTFADLADFEVQMISGALVAKAVYAFWTEIAAENSDLRSVEFIVGGGLSAATHAAEIACFKPSALARISTTRAYLRTAQTKLPIEGRAIANPVIDGLLQAGALVEAPAPKALFELLEHCGDLVGPHELNEVLAEGLKTWLFAPPAPRLLEELVCPHPSSGGIQMISGVYCETLRAMVDANLANLDSRQNKSPTLGNFLGFMERFENKVVAYGYFRAELIVEGIRVLKGSSEDVSQTLRQAFFDFCRDADEHGENETELFSWWD